MDCDAYNPCTEILVSDELELGGETRRRLKIIEDVKWAKIVNAIKIQARSLIDKEDEGAW